MPLTRRQLLASWPAGFLPDDRIDRPALVRRHNPVLRQPHPRSPLSLGNGEFAFTADVTGLQTFPEFHEREMPLCTQAQWGWHSFPRVPGELRLTPYGTYGRQVGYPTSPEGQQELYNWLRENPHRLHLGKIGLRLNKSTPNALAAVHQTLDLWTGILDSSFQIDGVPVSVRTCCHPECDLLAVSIRSRLRLPVVFEFPYGSPQMHAADWDHPERHRSTPSRQSPNRFAILCELDRDSYFVTIGWQGPAAIKQETPHRFVLEPAGRLDFVCLFSPRPPRQRTRTPHRPLSVLDRHPMRRVAAASGNRPHLQQLVRKVPPRDALVARRPFRPVGPGPSAGKEPRLVPLHPAQCAPNRQKPGIRRSPLTQDGRPRGPR